MQQLLQLARASPLVLAFLVTVLIVAFAFGFGMRADQVNAGDDVGTYVTDTDLTSSALVPTTGAIDQCSACWSPVIVDVIDPGAELFADNVNVVDDGSQDHENISPATTDATGTSGLWILDAWLTIAASIILVAVLGLTTLRQRRTAEGTLSSTSVQLTGTGADDRTLMQRVKDQGRFAQCSVSELGRRISSLMKRE